MSPVPSSVTACRGIPPPVRSASAPNCYRQRGGGGPRRPSREAAAGVRYGKVGVNAAETVEGAPVLVRYADDPVALCHSRVQALQVKERLAAWLAPRGLVFNEAKTRIVTIDEGLDFLGFNVRRYDGKLLIKPSKAALRRVRERQPSSAISGAPCWAL